MALTRLGTKAVESSLTNITDQGTEGSRLAIGTTGQRGSTQGQFRFNTSLSLAEYYDGNAFKIIDSPPTISSISPTTVTDANANITILGSGFASGATVKFVGSDGTEFSSPSVTINSATQITATTPSSALTVAKEPYDVVVTNNSGLFATLADALDAGGSPTWNTSAGTIATIGDNATGTHVTVSATDPDNQTITYSVQSGSLPGGTSLNTSTGAISGDVADVTNSTTSTFTLRASDGVNNTDRSFNIVVNPILDGSTAAKANTSAAAIKTASGTTTNGGYYIIDPSDSSNTIYAYCDMNFDGGGWMLVHSSRGSTWDGNTGNQSLTNFYNSSHYAEYTSGEPQDIYSKLRTNFSFTELLIQWTANADMTGATDATRPVYTMGSQSNLIGLSTNQTFNRKSGNTGALPTSGFQQLGAYNAGKLYYKLATSSDHRNLVFSNHTNSDNNQGGFYGWSGAHNSYAWGSSFNQTCLTVAFYIK